MAIDATGTWWRGETFADLAEYLRIEVKAGYPLGPVVQSACGCGGTVFHLDADRAEGGARRTCTSCGAAAYLADSGEYWDAEESERIRCPEAHDRFELAVGFSMREVMPGEVRWVTIGLRCAACGILGAPVDWEVDYSPSGHLLKLT